jgi:hypothetical protein
MTGTAGSFLMKPASLLMKSSLGPKITEGLKMVQSRPDDRTSSSARYLVWW